MSSEATATAPGMNSPPSTPEDGPVGRGAELSVTAREALAARARDIMAGRVPPPPLPIPDWVIPRLEKEFAGYDPPPTPEAIRFITDRVSLEQRYKGEPVAVFRMPDGFQAVLACGEVEILALLYELTHEEGAQVVVTDTLGGY